jgi:SAM-dependent methyltransferase
MGKDSAFAGSLPQIYEDCLVPILFEPYAIDIAARAAALAPRDLLEVAAGTGVVTAHLARALPEARIVASDLNPDMLRVAAGRGLPASIRWEPADAQALPFGDAAFDLVLAQFGVMFYPDRAAGYREAKRVLRAGGTFLFNVWDRIEANCGSHAVHLALQAALPEPKPGFLARAPFGYHDRALIETELRGAGFTEIAFAEVKRLGDAGLTETLLHGLVAGTPLAAELAAHPPELARRAEAAALQAVKTAAEREGGLTLQAVVVTAR